MEGSDDCFFFTQKDAICHNVNSPEAIVALAKKLHAIQKHKDAHHEEDGPKTFTPDIEHIEQELETHKSITPVPAAFSSSWNPEDQPLKYIFDKLRYDSAKLLNDLANYLYGYQWASYNDKTKLHPRLVVFLQLEYNELTEGCSVIYYRWQSSKLQDRYLGKLADGGVNAPEVAPSIIAPSVIGRGLGTTVAGSSSTMFASQLQLQQQQPFRSHLSSAASVSRSERSTATGTSHGADTLASRPYKSKRRAPAGFLHRKASRDENQSASRTGDKHMVPRLQFIWSATARQKEKEAEQCEQPVLTTSVATNAALISAESMPSGLSSKRPSAVSSKAPTRENLSVPPPIDVNRSITYLKRALELFGEMSRRRKDENTKWLESGRIYACRVICYGDRRFALLSRSKSAAIPTSQQDVSASTPKTAPTAPATARTPATARSVSATTQGPRPVTSNVRIPNAATSASEISRASISAFAVLSSLNTAIQHTGFHLHDAFHGKIPHIIPDSIVYKRSIFLAALPDGSYSAYYPDGKVAVVQSCYYTKSFPTPSHTTTLAYDHTGLGDLLLIATPKSFYAYAPKLSKRIYADKNNLTIITAEIHVETYAKWQSNRLKSAITVDLNDNMTLVLHSPDRISLTFRNQATAESFKFSVGFNLNLPVPPADIKYLQTHDVEFESKSASELLKTPVTKGKESKGARNYTFSQRSQPSAMTKSEQIAKKLGFIDNSYVSDVSVQLKRIRNKISWICESWLSHYCLWLGVTEIRGLATDLPAARLFNRRSAKRMAHSAGGLYRTQSLSDDEHNFWASEGSISDEGSLRRRRGKRASSIEARLFESSMSTIATPPLTEAQSKEKLHRVPTNVSLKPDTGRTSQLERLKSSTQRSISSSNASSPVPPQNAQMLADQQLRPSPSAALTELQLVGLCPASLRQYMTIGLEAIVPHQKFCHCNRQKAPLITDVELDLFLHKFAPQNQMIVIQIVNSLSNPSVKCGVKPSHADEFETMYDQLYNSISLYRCRPCVDAISDRFRLIRYDLAVAASNSVAYNPPVDLSGLNKRRPPLLLRRHNVHRGMTLMYRSGGLVSCGYITPATSEALIRQIEQSWHLALRSFKLPSDYRMSMSITTHANGVDSVSKSLVVQDDDQPTDDEAILTAAFLARDGPHSARHFPCLHVPTA